MQQLWSDFINWIKASGLTEILSIGITTFLSVFVPRAFRNITNAKANELNAVATNKAITENYDANQKKTTEDIESLKNTIKELKTQTTEAMQTIEKLGGIIALLISNAKTNNFTKEQALKLFKIPSEKIEVQEQAKTTHELVEEIVNTVTEDVKTKVEKEESGQYDTLVNDLLKDYVK